MTLVTNMNVMIITMFSGENEYEQCKESVKNQITEHNVAHRFIENKQNLEAHNELYKIVMVESDKFDYFVKLDADMVFEKESALQDLVTMAGASGADIFSIPVHDYMTNSMIWGINVYRSGLRWLLGTESLFTDQQQLDGEFVSAKKNISMNESLVSHAKSPTEYQAFVFGVHRASKVVQEETDNFLLGHAWVQLCTLCKVLDAYRSGGDRKRAFAIIGAYYTLKKLNDRVGLKSKKDFIGEFELVNFARDIDKSLRYFRGGRIAILLRSVEFSRLLAGLFEYIKRRSL